MSSNGQAKASQPAKGEGKRVRRARNVVKRSATWQGITPKMQRRLERAKAVLAYDALSK